jgi:phosphotransferase system  glucose/maltose/N-acetylglucosamine-specific IIC component
MTRNQPQVGETGSGEQPSQFDFLLAAIPLALLAGVGSVVFFSVPQFIGVTVGAGVAAGLIGYSVYAVTQVESTVDSRERRFHDRPNRAD